MRRHYLGFVALACIGMACSKVEPTAIGHAGEAIIDGQVDQADQAVVALFRSNPTHPEWDYACSGTIVARNGSTAFVLTAAHCTRASDETAAQGDPGPTADELFVVQGNDYATANIQYPVTQFTAHPSYVHGPNGTVYDFAVLTITGAGAATPTLPFATPANDPLVPGGNITIVGYGRVTHPEADGAPFDRNSLRHSLDRTIADLEPLLVGYTDADGALTCNGDSGGPELAPISGTKTVVGVTSFGGLGCFQYGYGGRVSAVADWIQGYIDGNVTTAPTCDDCWTAATSGVGVCSSAVNACRADAECNALSACFGQCLSGDSACFHACETTHPSGVATYGAILDCACTAPACAAACKDTTCKQGCGLNFGTDTCGSCVETSCCAENAACAADGTCANCFVPNPPASCGQNARYRALAHCVVSGCHNQCDYGKCGIVSDTAACTACMDSRCCAETLNCIGKQGCYDCVVGFTSAGCGSIPEYVTQLDCLRQKCGGPADCNVPTPPIHALPGSGGSGGIGSGGASGNSGAVEVGASGAAGAGARSTAGAPPTSTAGAAPLGEPTKTTSCDCRNARSPVAPSDGLFVFMAVLASIVRRRRR